MQSFDNEPKVALNSPAATENEKDTGTTLKPPAYGLPIPFPNMDDMLKGKSSNTVELSDNLKVANTYAQDQNMAPDLSNYEQQKVSQVSIGSITQRIAIVNQQIRICYSTVFRQVAATGPTGAGNSKGDGGTLANTYITVQKLIDYKSKLLKDLEIARAAGQTH